MLMFTTFFQAGMTPIMLAVRQRNFDVLQYLVEYCGGDINVQNKVNLTFDNDSFFCCFCLNICLFVCLR
jgi:hypothetical protein